MTKPAEPEAMEIKKFLSPVEVLQYMLNSAQVLEDEIVKTGFNKEKAETLVTKVDAIFDKYDLAMNGLRASKITAEEQLQLFPEPLNEDDVGFLNATGWQGGMSDRAKLLN